GCTSHVEPTPPASIRPYPDEGFRSDSTPLPDGRYRYTAGSPPAALGVPYRYSIHVHCGIDQLVDFDGSFWEIDGASPALSQATPEINGTITLVEEDRAVFELDSGDKAEFRRDGTEKRLSLCS
ncbi:MAG: hypothetical protein LC722_04565, partial [Actinobacteria bacterium]|nr:hypothetical protein [Actinomycetota bacterium]